MLSTAIHGLLLLGAALIALDHVVVDDGDPSAFSCRLADATLRYDRLDRPKDHFGTRIPGADLPSIGEVTGRPGTFGEDPVRVWSICCECGCGGATTTLAAWPRDVAGYFDRKLSMATSWRGAPRLKTHSRSCASRETGIDADCSCGLIPRQN